jgi:hypothetical protein
MAFTQGAAFRSMFPAICRVVPDTFGLGGCRASQRSFGDRSIKALSFPDNPDEFIKLRQPC